MSSASVSSNTGASSAVSAFIIVLGEDSFLFADGGMSLRHHSYKNKRELVDRHTGQWCHHCCKHACRRQTGGRRPPPNTQAEPVPPVGFTWRLAFLTESSESHGLASCHSDSDSGFHKGSTPQTAALLRQSLAGHHAVRGPALLTFPSARPLAPCSSSVVRNSETSTSRPYARFSEPAAPRTQPLTTPPGPGSVLKSGITPASSPADVRERCFPPAHVRVGPVIICLETGRRQEYQREHSDTYANSESTSTDNRISTG